MIHLNLGSNLNSILGSRYDNLTIATNLLIEAKIKITKISNFYETPSYPNQRLPKFLNIGILARFDNNYIELLPLVREKVKSIICIGLDNEKIIESFSPVVDVLVETQSMSEAVKIAHKLANKKDYVLLSPACASFDLFKNFEDRGNQFKQAVRNL